MPSTDPNRTETGLRIGSESDDNRTSETDSHERTYGRTEILDTAVYQETAVDAGACIEDFTSIGEVIAAGELWQTDRRHPIVRTGEREPIPSHVRAAIWYRDRGECDHCRYGKLPDHIAGPLHLDHIKPWSAGGTDESSNLRLLCEYHNLRRSNFVDFDRPKMPVTWWCLHCYSADQPTWVYLRGGFVECPTHSRRIDGTSRCRVVRRYQRAWERGEVSNWHERDALEDGDQTAYCAHCNCPSLTAVVL
jgi:hypothetical protein